MTTTVRSVRVEMELGIARYVANAQIVGRETEAMANRIERSTGTADRGVSSLDSSTGNLAKTSAEARIQQGGLSDGIDRTGRSASRAESSIDKYSGRLKTILGLVQILGPAALRLGAGSLPALSAGFAGLGAGAGGIAVTALALTGVKDALKALNDYELERTPENLRKVQQAFAEIGPEGAHFVQTLRDLDPEIEHLQQLARAGVLPGFEDSIDSMVTRLPIVSQIVNRLSNEVGHLSADAGEALAGDKWTPFFEYVRATAAPTLDDFARSTGNVALGLANILVAFDPLTRSFTGGLEDMTSRFARWSQGLEDDEGFQAFLDEVREAGPEVLDFLGSMIDLMVGLARASAPVGHIVLPILTGAANAIAAIANTPLGPVLYTAATAWTVYGRAAALAQKSTTAVQSSWAGMSKGGKAGAAAAGIALVASAFTDLDDKAGAANTTTLGLTGFLAGGGIGAAAGATAGLILDISHANDDLAESTTRANEALRSGDTSQMRDELAKLRDEIEETNEAATFGFQDLVTTWAPGAAVLSGGIDKVGSAWSRFRGEEDEAKATAAELDSALGSTTSRLTTLRPLIGGTADELIDAAQGAQQLSNALAVLNGWFDKRDAMRSYKDAIHEIAQGLKDGFSRDDVSNIDAAGRSILQVANLIQNPERRASFLAGAREQLEDVADRSGPRAAAAIQKVIDKFDSEGLTNPPPIKLTADDKAAEAAFTRTRRSMSQLDGSTAEPVLDAEDGPARGKIDGVKGLMRQLSSSKATPGIDVQAGGALNVISNVQRALDNMRDGYVTVHVNRAGGVTSEAGGHSADVPGGADGTTVHGRRQPYGDKLLYAVAPGEEIISNRHGQADRHRNLLKAINAGRYGADGRTAGDLIRSTYTRRAPAVDTATDGSPAANHAASADDRKAKAADRVEKALRKLENRLDKITTSYEKSKAKLDDLVSQRSSLSSSIASAAIHDPFGNGLAGLDAQVDADTADVDSMATALAQLVKNGLNPKSALYQQLAASMDVNTAQQLAQLSAGDLALRAQRFDALGTKAQALGDTVAGQQFNESINAATKATDRLEKRMHSLEDAVRDLKHLPKDVGEAVFHGAHDGSQQGSEKGTRAGSSGKAGAAALVATGGRPLTHRGRGKR